MLSDLEEGVVMNLSQKTLKSANVCVYLFVNTYTQNTPVQKRSVVHHLWPKKKTKRTKKVFTYIFFFCVFPMNLW